MDLSRSCSTLAILAWTIASSSAARAQGATYVVDDGGGPGVSFTDIPPAVAAAVPGDTLIVRAGSYSAFGLDEGLTIVGETGVFVATGVAIHDVPAGERAIVAVLDFEAVSIVACAGAVVFDTCTFDGVAQVASLVRVDQSTDVRFRECAILPEQVPFSFVTTTALSVSGSRVELSSCTVAGAKGADWPGPRPGGAGIQCNAGARVHVALSEVRGGDGGDGDDNFAVNGASGGPAIHGVDGSETIVAGIASIAVIGGSVGEVQGYCCLASWPGHGFKGTAASWLRYSGAPILDGAGSSAAGISSTGTVVHALPDDPTLDMDVDPYPGAEVSLTLYAVPGTLGQLQQGTTLLVDDDGQSVIEKLTNRVLHRPFGIVPANGVAVRTYRVRANWPTGRLAVFQGLERDSSINALLERTNSVPLIVR
jgi:hypothetical protein